MNSLQQNRGIVITTEAGADVLLLYRMSVRDRLSRPFEISLELLSSDQDLNLSDLLGTTASIEMLVGSGSRHLHGHFNRISWAGRHGEYARYQATLVPWLWFLTRTADCRIFQGKTVPEIVTQVFRDQGFTDFVDGLSGTYRQWDYCVQYRESDFDFVSRLMEQEGIYYFFTHSGSQHKLHLADDYSSHAASLHCPTLPFYPPDATRMIEVEHVSEWSVSLEVQTGIYVLNDFDFERPRADLLSKSDSSRKHKFADFEVFDYPGEYSQSKDGTHYSRRRIEEQQARFERVNGRSNSLGLDTGALFSLEAHPRSDQNREYLLVSTDIDVVNSEYETGQEGEGASIDCFFEAMDSTQVFRSERETPLPRIRGPQTAVVVGKQGEEIWTDKFGRVKVQFHWDREGKSDENSSCWVRVAQSWAGKRWGTMHIPRIGQEVIVEFLEGDPDRPIITGRVYNADEMPPYDLPKNQTQSGIKTQSTAKATNQNFNELRFEDLKGSEQVYFHAEKDFERVVENNDTLKVGFEKKDDGDQVIEIFNNQKVVIGDAKAKDGSQTITVLKNFQHTISKGDATIAIEKGKRTTTIYADDALTIKTGNRIVGIKAGAQETTAAKSILLKVGGSSIKIEPTAITISSVKVVIDAKLKAEVKGTLVDANASGILTLKGGLAKIN